MRVIVVKARAIREHEVAFDFLETKRPVLIDFEIGRFVRVLQQLRVRETRAHRDADLPDRNPISCGRRVRCNERTSSIDSATTSTDSAP